jgi:hypothetical protein
MEKIPKQEKISLVEKQRQEAFAEVLDLLVERFPVELKKSFESHGREYALTSAEDCMVAFAQQNREAVESLYEEIKDKDDYRTEQAVAKLYALFLAYEKTVALYAELRSYYPTVASKVEEQLPPLSYIAEHGNTQWKKINH